MSMQRMLPALLAASAMAIGVGSGLNPKYAGSMGRAASQPPRSRRRKLKGYQKRRK